jgi:hypothetical protein
MTGEVTELGDVRVLQCPVEGPPIRYAEAVALVGEALGADAPWVAVPAARLGEDFFRLSTGVAGEVIQKFVNYRRRLAVVGDVSAHVAQSDALRDFVVESNRGAHVWFVRDLAELEARLAQAR